MAMGLLTRLCLVSVCACADEADDDGPCWVPPEPDAEQGQVQLGTGERAESFTVLAPDQDLPLIYGLQGGHHFAVRTSIRGMTPGDEGNTVTRFSAFMENGQQIDVFQCPFRWDYVPQPGSDSLLLVHEVSLIVDEAFVPQLPDTRVLLRAEVIDSEGRYAFQEQSVIARSP